MAHSSSLVILHYSVCRNNEGVPIQLIWHYTEHCAILRSENWIKTSLSNLKRDKDWEITLEINTTIRLIFPFKTIIDPDHSLQKCNVFLGWGYRGQCGAVDSIKGGLIHGDIIHWFLKACFEVLRLAFSLSPFWFQRTGCDMVGKVWLWKCLHIWDNPPFWNIVWPKWVTEPINPTRKCLQRSSQKGILTSMGPEVFL